MGVQTSSSSSSSSSRASSRLTSRSGRAQLASLAQPNSSNKGSSHRAAHPQSCLQLLHLHQAQQQQQQQLHLSLAVTCQQQHACSGRRYMSSLQIH